MADQELKRSGLLELIRTEEIQELYDANEKLMGSKSLRNMDKKKRNSHREQIENHGTMLTCTP